MSYPSAYNIKVPSFITDSIKSGNGNGNGNGNISNNSYSKIVKNQSSFCPRKYRLVFLTIIAIILATVLTSMSIIINDPAVYYQKQWFIGSIVCNIIIISYLVYLIYVSKKLKNIFECNKLIPNIKYTSSIFTLFLFGLVSIFLIAFGLNSINKNEIINKDQQYVDSILYYYKNIVNDNIAIFSTLAGVIVILLTVSDYLFC